MLYKLLTLTSRDAAPESHQVRAESLKTLERGMGGGGVWVGAGKLLPIYSPK